MIILLLFSAYCETINYTALFNYTLRPQQYGQIMPNTFNLFKINQDYDPGQISINITLDYDETQTFKYDLMFFNNPYNAFYICYIDMMLMETFTDCAMMYAQLCQPCSIQNSQEITENITRLLSSAMSTKFESQSSINNSLAYVGNYSLCYLGCDSQVIKNISMTDLSIIDMNNSISVIVVDNTDYPSLKYCNYKEADCHRNNTSNLTNYCAHMLPFYCEEPERVPQDLKLQITYNLDIVSNEKVYEFSTGELTILIILICVFGFILCLLQIRFRRILRHSEQIEYPKSKY